MEKDLSDIQNVDKKGQFFNQKCSKSLTFDSNPCHEGTYSKQLVPVLLPCNANGSNKLPPHATGKYESPHCFKEVTGNHY
jgi:hypothetical protein